MFKKIYGILIIFIILILIPTCFALDNDTALMQTDDNVEIVSGQIDSEITPKNVDYYFNSSQETDGDGSLNNPYNFISSTRLKEGSTIHLANGEYSLSTGKSLNKVTIIGDNPEKTIIKYTGSSKSGKITVDADNYLTMKNVTFIGFNFDIEGGILDASNTIFKNAVAFPTYSSATNLVNSATNSYGGAIYAYYTESYYETYLPTVILDNCTFVNNTAEYGGAILMNYGTLDISNSLFINNSAYNYGGAIAGLYQVSIRLKNTKFINDNSINDAGGAIYALRSSVSANNISIINCSSTFGAGITSLNSTTAIIYLTAENNHVKYEGGVLYQMYNAISISDSNFTNNSARNGGAVYVDDIEIFKMTYNNFVNNSAVLTAGAVYQLQTRHNTVNNNNYKENRAKKYEDIYETDSIVMKIGNGNISFYNNTYEFDGNIPDKFDLRDYDYVTPVRDQQSGGNCWAFGSLASLESAILKISGDKLDLSEENMKNLMQTYSDYGWRGIETNNGGYDEMFIGYLTSWLGPVLEEYEQYDDYSMLSPVLNSITHVQNIVYLKRSNYTDNNAIKEAIMKYGAVSTGIYYDSSYFNSAKNSYYYYGSSYSNHAVAIVGWDDNYTSSNFYYKPAGNGAWIVKNSWGSSWGDNGYFYASYYDTRLAQIGEDEYNYAFVFNDSERYDKNYQYDISGKTDYFLTGNKTIWVENIFNSTDNELLAAVSTYFRKVTEWELFIYINDQLALTKTGISNPGYNTIHLGEYIPISEGDLFKVVFKFSSETGGEFAISEKSGFNRALYYPGVSYFSEDGINWIDLYDYTFNTELDNRHYYSSQVACIKAFTILYELKPTINLTVTSKYNKVNITAVIYDQYNNLIHSGEIELNIDGNNYTVKIENTKANFLYEFDSIGIHEIDAIYKSTNIHKNISVSKIDIKLNITIGTDKDNAIIILNSLYKVDAAINLTINNNKYPINLINGLAKLKLNNLDFGDYNIIVNVDDEYYGGDINTNFNITISKTRIIAKDLIAYHNIETFYSILLEDIYGNPVPNRQVSLVVGGKSYVGVTNKEGITSITLRLDKNSKYKMNIMFYGDNDYFSCNANPNIEVKSTINILTSDTYISNFKVDIGFLNQNGEPLVKNQISLKINGLEYWIITDNNGKVSKDLNLNIGSYELTVYNPETNEKLSKTINILPRIIGNKNINMYEGGGNTYQIRVYGDDGNFVGSGEVIKININSKTYNLKTNVNGYVSFKITEKPKTYKITATYKGFYVSNKIVIKPILTAKNIAKKKSKKIKFSAKLVNNKGKAVKGKKITFKIKSKTYSAKTNKKGIATINLKNLKVGKYSITTKYRKSVINNTIRVK